MFKRKRAKVFAFIASFTGTIIMFS